MAYQNVGNELLFSKQNKNYETKIIQIYLKNLSDFGNNMGRLLLTHPVGVLR